MAIIEQTPVMDVSPWPTGRGFEGANDWWAEMLSKDEMQRLDNLMGAALLDTDVRNRLVTERDETLFSAFGLSEPTQEWLRGIRAGTLNELAQAIVARTQYEACATY